MKKLFNFVIFVAIIYFSLFIILSIINRDTTPERQEYMIDARLVEYVHRTQIFEIIMIVNGDVSVARANFFLWTMAHPHGGNFDSSFTELIFVHNQEEAQGFPPNVIVVWPTEHPLIHSVMDIFNQYVARNENELHSPERPGGRYPINLENFGLSYPITINDLVENWEGVFSVWKALTENERGGIRP